MSTETLYKRRPKSAGRPVAFILLGALLCLTAVLAAGFGAGIRINTTPSEPLGLWRIVQINRPVEIGDLVFVCMPDSTEREEGKSRGYLRWGICPGGTGPLIKEVVAMAGQQVAIDTSVSIDGVRLDRSLLVKRDGLGRPLRPYLGGIVPAGRVFLHSPFEGSWDSRYFGPVPVSGILGRAREVLTYAP
ncbi:conjugative transfer signal peptidase TraF [Agrobacterium sp. Ap1]|jgi:conjugative transfer signal peptidase TraF|uniref:conjugative transfer signal peptidase TraF n=1 Tax=Agrobacterium sp. Ap1 TaxID=2815337 RepID=UPI0011D153D8|nr:conjugative transfer signal peptidase TraF [Agrobacterium sp. Ap1]MBO0144744.1 conjugative transfer signal peptidase TraF [Agrobacterium sp. Ap1]